jgi:PrtD family type I secretion system ABC transporter
MLAAPLYMLQVIDRVLRSGSGETLVLLTVMACFAVLVMSVLDTLRSAIAMRLGSWLNEHLGPVYMESNVRAQLRADYSGMQAMHDLGELQSFIAHQGMAAFFDFPWVPVFVAIMWFMHPLLGTIALLSAATLFILSIANDFATRKPSERANEAQIEAMHIADVTFRNAEVIGAMGMLPVMIGRWRAINAVVSEGYRIAGEKAGHILSITKFVRYSVQIAVLGTGAWLVVQNTITTGTMIAASILLGRALAPVEMAIGGWKSFISARLAYHRLKLHLQDYPPEQQRTLLPNPTGQLSVVNLGYWVPASGHVILRDISFDVSPGQVLAVVGESGAGKSTLCRLLVGLTEPSSGAVLLDGSPLGHWRRDQLGRNIGFLPQDVELFPGTIRENIARMNVADDDSTLDAAIRSYAHPIIQKLPQGYETVIGDGGLRLSGGQRQRVGLARALFGMPRLIVLDEPNANLDHAGEAALAKALQEMKQHGCTIIIVGHRPSTLEQADKILVMNDGTMTQFGDRDDILRSWEESAESQSAADVARLQIPEVQSTGKDGDGKVLLSMVAAE